MDKSVWSSIDHVDESHREGTDAVARASATDCIAIDRIDRLPASEPDQSELEIILQSLVKRGDHVNGIYPLSPLQEGMLFHRLLNESSDTYILSTLFELGSRERLDALVKAIHNVIKRHDALRTAVFWQKLSRPIQVVFREVTLPIQVVQLEKDQGAVDQMKERLKPVGVLIDLQRAPLMRLQVAEDQSSSRWYALLQVHHLICDHQALRDLIGETMAYIEGREEELPSPVPFRAYLSEALASVDLKGGESFFSEKLKSIDQPTAPYGLLDVHGSGEKIQETVRAVDVSLAAKVRFSARQQGMSAARLFHAAWALVVARTSGREDVVFGTVLRMSRQRGSRRERMLGLSVNTLPLRLMLKGVSVAGLLELTDRELDELVIFESVPLTLAQRCSGLAGSAPLFTSILNFRRSPPELAATSGVEAVARGEAWTNYPVTLTVDDLGDGFLLMAKTDPRIGAAQQIEYLVTALESVLSALEKNPDVPALALDIIPTAERRRLIQTFNATQATWPESQNIHELFEKQAKLTPQTVAVTDTKHALTYAELNRKANQVARSLRDHGIRPDERVAICLERGVDMVVGMLGTLKAGGAYVPIDVANPIERVHHILKDAKPRVVLTQLSHFGVIPPSGSYVMALDREWAKISELSGDNLASEAVGLRPDNLAYVMYTSGSTGKPKGVMVEHRNVVNYIAHASRQFDVASGNGSLICTSFSFDLMLTGLYPALICGKTVYLGSQEHDWQSLRGDLLELTWLAPLKLTPSHLPLLEESLMRGELNGKVKALVLGGEVLRGSAIKSWRRSAPETRIFNHYGPTETTIGAIVYEVGAEVPDIVPIGRPISNARIYILDRQMQVVPIGAAGEIYIGGCGVTRGYLNNPELTSARFVADPFSSDSCSRMYRTGDLARWRGEGSIEYLGRNDHQVKIRGFRIELREIEAGLGQAEDVGEAAVLVREDIPGDKRLVAYVSPRARDRPPRVEQMRTHLRDALPDYMIPAAFVIVDRFPLTPNGKLDRKALPEPEYPAYTSRNYEPPEDDIELALAGIWQALLRVGQVGRHDNFFELGGHSLTVMQVVARLEANLEIHIPMRTIFEFPTLAELADELTRMWRANLLEGTADTGTDVNQLLERIDLMSESEVRKVLAASMREGAL